MASPAELGLVAVVPEEDVAKKSSATIDISSLPPALRSALAAFDTDGSGSINASELGAAAVGFAALQKTNANLWRSVVGLVVALVVVILISFGVMCVGLHAARLCAYASFGVEGG